MATIKKIAMDLNWESSKKAIHGEYKGFTVSVVQNINIMNAQENFKILYIPLSDLSTGNAEQLAQYIQVNKKVLKFFTFDLKKDLLRARLVETFKSINAVLLTSILDILYKGFLEANVTPKTTCAYCGEGEVDTQVYINNVKLPSHNSCKQDAIAKLERIRQEEAGQSNSMMGYVGAILGAIVGVIPYTIVVWFGWYVGLLTILTGFASYQGFKIFGGRTKKPTKFIVGIISLIVILLSNVALMEFIAIQYSVTLADVLAVDELREIFWQSMGMSALFGLLGVAVVVARIKKDEFHSEIK